MKKGKKLLITASLVSTAMSMGGCRFLPWENSEQPVYGVPMSPTVTMTPVPGYEEEEDAAEETSMTEGEISFSPEENLAQCMYGPPLDREDILKIEE